jgi:hypothetical protein
LPGAYDFQNKRFPETEICVSVPVLVVEARTMGTVANIIACQRLGGHLLDAKFEKAFRETLSPLKSLKTAKFHDFRTQEYQGLSKTHDFAGETISLRFGFIWKGARGGPGCKNLEKAPTSIKGLLCLITP